MTWRSMSRSLALLGCWALLGGLGACKRRPPDADLAAAGGAAPASAPAPASASAPAAAAPAGPDAKVLPPGYDPTELVRGGADPLQVYLEEPRHPVWAARVEEVIGGQIRRDISALVPETRSVAMGCRTLSCLILIDVPASQLEEAQSVATLVTMGPITVNLGLSPEGRAQLLFLTEPRMADATMFTDWYKRTRRKVLEAIREGKQPNPLKVPVADLPRD